MQYETDMQCHAFLLLRIMTELCIMENVCSAVIPGKELSYEVLASHPSPKDGFQTVKKEIENGPKIYRQTRSAGNVNAQNENNKDKPIKDDTGNSKLCKTGCKDNFTPTDQTVNTTAPSTNADRKASRRRTLMSQITPYAFGNPSLPQGPKSGKKKRKPPQG